MPQGEVVFKTLSEIVKSATFDRWLTGLKELKPACASLLGSIDWRSAILVTSRLSVAGASWFLKASGARYQLRTAYFRYLLPTAD